MLELSYHTCVHIVVQCMFKDFIIIMATPSGMGGGRGGREGESPGMQLLEDERNVLRTKWTNVYTSKDYAAPQGVGGGEWEVNLRVTSHLKGRQYVWNCCCCYFCCYFCCYYCSRMLDYRVVQYSQYPKWTTLSVTSPTAPTYHSLKRNIHYELLATTYR